MSFPLDRQQLGAPDYGVRKGTVGVVIHTTEGTDSSLAAGLSTARWQASTGNTSGGSYHFILTDDGPILTVPYRDSAGSLSGDHRSPAQGGHWAPSRYPYLLEEMGTAAYADPNAYLVAISISGKTALLQSYAHIDRIIDDCARIIVWVEQVYKVNAIVSGHYMWQTDRSDPGTWFFTKVMERYQTITSMPDTATESDPMFVAQMKPLVGENPFVGSVAAGINIRTEPNLDPLSIEFTTAAPSGIGVVAYEVVGAAWPVGSTNTRWYCFVGAKGLRVVHSSAVSKKVPLKFLAEVEATVSAATAPLNAKITELQAVTTDLNAVIAGQKKTISDQQAAITVLNTQITSLQGNIVDLSAKLAVAQPLAALAKELQDVFKRLAAA